MLVGLAIVHHGQMGLECSWFTQDHFAEDVQSDTYCQEAPGLGVTNFAVNCHNFPTHLLRWNSLDTYRTPQIISDEMGLSWGFYAVLICFYGI